MVGPQVHRVPASSRVSRVIVRDPGAVAFPVPSRADVGAGQEDFRGSIAFPPEGGLPGSRGGMAFSLSLSSYLNIVSGSPPLPPSAWPSLVCSRRRTASKAVRFRAGACAASPTVAGAARPFPLCWQCRLLPRSRHAT
jgi:hypothetical protein